MYLIASFAELISTSPDILQMLTILMTTVVPIITSIMANNFKGICNAASLVCKDNRDL